MSEQGPGIMPHAPYVGYTPMAGIIPPMEAPGFPTKCCRPTNQCVVTASQPVIPVPVTQEILRKQKIIEVDQTVVTDKVVPKVYHQEVFHEVPKLALDVTERRLDIPQLRITEEPREVNVAVGFNFRIDTSFDNREVPRLFPKYVGKTKTIEVGIPQIQIVDKKVDHEVPVYVGEKFVEKEVIQNEGVEVVQYKYVKREETIPVYKYRPVFDVEVSIPPPVIVPVPVAPQEKALEAEHITYQDYKRQKRGCVGNAARAISLAACAPSCQTCCGPCCCYEEKRDVCGSPPELPQFTPKLQHMQDPNKPETAA